MRFLMMILISAQIEIERANFACDFDFNRKQQTRLLEGEHECFFKLHKPITFQVTRMMIMVMMILMSLGIRI